MKIYIDADGCPVVKETIEVATAFLIPVVIVCDVAHEFFFDGVEVVTVMRGMDAVDYEIMNRLEVGDLVIAQDYGLAALVLAKRGYALNQNGRQYDENNIDELLYRRHTLKKLRQAGERVKGPRKRSKEDTAHFVKALTTFLTEICETCSR